jgi:hypothetical protein
VKSLALVVGLLIVAIGVVGIVAPDVLVSIGRYSITPVGLYIAGGLRVAIGVVLLGASPASRAPKTLRVCGILALVAGVTTPLLGIERAGAIMDWWSAAGPAVERLWALLAVAFDSFITYVVVSGRRAA